MAVRIHSKIRFIRMLPATSADPLAPVAEFSDGLAWPWKANWETPKEGAFYSISDTYEGEIQAWFCWDTGAEWVWGTGLSGMFREGGYGAVLYSMGILLGLTLIGAGQPWAFPYSNGQSLAIGTGMALGGLGANGFLGLHRRHKDCHDLLIKLKKTR